MSFPPASPPPELQRSREEVRFLADLVARPLSTTVSRYQRLGLSRRRGNAIRHVLASAGLIEAVPIATRSGQVVLYQLTELGRMLCPDMGIDPGPPSRPWPSPRPSLEHRYWVHRAEDHFTRLGYQVTNEYVLQGNGAVDLLVEGHGKRLAVEIETGKSKIKTNIEKVRGHGFDKVILIATSPSAVTACQRAMDQVERGNGPVIELWTWLDVS